MAKINLEELRRSPVKLTPEQAARLDAMTDNEIDHNARTDPVCPELTDEQLEQAVRERAGRRTKHEKSESR